MKTTIYLDDDLAERLRRLVPPRKLNRLINSVLADKARQLEEQQLQAELRAGYIAAEEEEREVSADWSALDVEDWPA